MSDPARRRPATIGLLSPLAGGYYHADVVAGAHAAAHRHGARLIVVQTSASWPEGVGQLCPAPYVPLAWDHVDGFVVTVDALDPTDLQRLAATGKPLVTLSMPHPDASGAAVMPDNFGGTLAAVRHLLDHGHQRIGFAGYTGHDDIRYRYLGYQAALAERGIALDPTLYFAVSDDMEAGGREAAVALLAAGLPCTAVFAATDRNALALIEAVQAAGYRVPEDLAVVGFDDAPLAQQAVPALTTVRQRADALGEVAVECLLAALAGKPTRPGAMLVPTALICRHSCGCTGMNVADRLPDTAYTGPDWRERLAEDLALLLVAPLRPVAGTPPGQIWPGVEVLVEMLEVAVLDGRAPHSAALDRVWQAACARTQSGETHAAIITLLEAAGLARLRQHVPGATAAPDGLRGFLNGARIRILRFSMRHLQGSDHAQQALSRISRSFHNRHALEAVDLSWLASAAAHRACVGLWESDHTEGGRDLRIAASYSAERGAEPGSDALVCPQAFPPASFLAPSADEHENPVALLLPLGTPDRDWGVLAVVGPVEGAFHEGYDALRHGATELALALEHATLLAASEQQQEQLRQSEMRFRRTFDDAPIGMATTDAAYRYLSLNRAHCAMLGYTEEELLGRTYADITHPDERVHQGRRSGDKTVTLTTRYLTKDGRTIWVEVTSAKLLNPDGSLMFRVSMIQDITDRRQAEEALRQAKEEAERANQAKSEFLSRMSHELRTPLNAILGFAQVLGLDALTPKQHKRIAHIERAGRHLLTLINEVLDLARIEEGRLEPSLEPVPIHAVVQECLDLVGPLADQALVSLRADLAIADEQHLRADQQRLKQVLVNLLTNAVKYNRRGGSVTIAGTLARPEWLRLAVVDTGPGIPPEQLERLFVPFERLDAEQSDVEGTGLGLALSRRLMEVMGGTIGVESKVGVGSTFWIELPLAQAPPRSPSAGTEQRASLPAPAATHMVLQIEDNPSNFAVLEAILEQRPQVRLLTAMQGSVGVHLAQQHRPDLILLDLHLPDLRGDEVLRRLKDNPATVEIPVVMVSADATNGQAQRLLSAGARAYLTKPLEVQQVLRLVDDIATDATQARR